VNHVRIRTNIPDAKRARPTKIPKRQGFDEKRMLEVVAVYERVVEDKTRL